MSGCCCNCYNCRHADMSPYSPATQWEPEEPSVPIGCECDHSSVDLTPDEGCVDWEERKDYSYWRDEAYERSVDK